MVVLGRKRVLANLKRTKQILERVAREGIEWHHRLDKEAIRTQLEDSQTVPGVQLGEYGKSLRIRWTFIFSIIALNENHSSTRPPPLFSTLTHNISYLSYLICLYLLKRQEVD